MSEQSQERPVSMWARARQLFYPREFRIAPAVAPSQAYHELQRRIDELRTETDRLNASHDRVGVDHSDGAERAADGELGIDDAALVNLATGLWRTRRRLTSVAENDPSLARALGRQLRPSWDGLERMDVLVQDHDGEIFDSGLPLEALAIQPEPGLTEETIIETVAPTILRSGRRVQMGQVIVGRPERPTS